MKKVFSTIAALLCLLACSPVKIKENMVIVKPKSGEATAVRLQVISPEIVRVSAVKGNKFPKDASLAVVAQPQFRDFEIEQSDHAVVLKTSALRVELRLDNGQVSFFRADGSPVLQEKPLGRSFEPIEVDGSRGWTVAQTFLSPSDDEGLYGLGQHQSEEFNYKGRSEELFQYNTKVSVPFIMSTSNYGLLWDSYSYCRFGNPLPYSDLSNLFELCSKDGKDGCLTGTYISPEKTLVREEKAINFDHLITGDLDHVYGLPRDFSYQDSKVVYEGYITPYKSGEYNFSLYYSGYQSVEIDGKKLVPERWRTAWNPNSYKFSVELEEGRRIPIKISWQPNGSVAYCGLKAYGPESKEEKNCLRWWGEMQQQIDYYFIAGGNADEIIAGCRKLTGKAPIMPKWALGYWQSREKYNTQQEVLEVLNEYRRRNIPIDNIVIDWLHWEQDSWGSHEFDRARFPQPKEMVDSIHAMDGRVMISVWPKFYVTTEHYKEFDSRGWMYTKAVQDSIRDWVGPGYLGSFYDAYNPDARKLFWQQMYEHYYPLGFDAWWMDASEPNIRDCTDMDYRKALCGPTYLGSSTEFFNAYALMNAEAIYDGQRAVDPDKRVFLLTRSGFAGQQRYSTATWSGDIATRWEDMRAQLTAGLNFCACGVPYWTMDIGGFCVEDRYVRAQQYFNETGIENADLREWRELNARWFQFGAFCPLFRAHGQWPYREIYNIAPEGHIAYESMTYYTRLRYRLLPYIYSLAADVHFEDYTLMRALFMDFGEDEAVRNIGDEYMFGPAFLVAPVCEYGARQRKVYFPRGEEGLKWYSFYDNSEYAAGSSCTVPAPYSRMPLFVPSGSIVPMGEVLQSTAAEPVEALEIHIFPGRNGKFCLYDDEALNYNYEKGAYSKIPLSWDDASSTFTIGEREGSYPGMNQNRSFRLVLEGAHPKTRDIEYNGQKIETKI